jgi:hypothetical protein
MISEPASLSPDVQLVKREAMHDRVIAQSSEGFFFISARFYLKRNIQKKFGFRLSSFSSWQY